MSYSTQVERGAQTDDARSNPTETTTNDFLLNEHEVAKRQGRSVRTLQNQRVQGGGIPYLKLGRAVRYRLSDVIAWEEARRFSSTSDEGRRNA